MTELLISRGDTFPRSFLDTYRSDRSATTQKLYNDLSASKSDELVLQNSESIEFSNEIHHGHSENLIDVTSLSHTKEDFLNKKELSLSKGRRRQIPVCDRIDPEDSIRDIVTENDFLQMERDDLIEQREKLTRRLESSESLLREKEDEVFLQFERVVYLEEQCDRLKAEKDRCEEKKGLIERERDRILRILKEQARESEFNRRSLERARHEVVHHMTKIKNEKEYLERENDKLKETLETERRNMDRYLMEVQRRTPNNLDPLENQEEVCKLIDYNSDALTSQFQKAVQHLATCREKKCSVCAYVKSTYRRMTPRSRNHKLFSCLQTPFLEMRNMIKPPPSPIHGEGESLSEWFCHMNTNVNQSECSSVSVPLAELSISYMDDVSDTYFNYLRDSDKEDCDALSQGNSNSIRVVSVSPKGEMAAVHLEIEPASKKLKYKFVVQIAYT
ncbi:hypothetical protein NQ315_013396 [Exocentrus adspersus]|uniref:Uncharacterized protein n=1 Tax=Exocentrus adspersus TaxID=1586481 RepID=A0AAV8VSS6_9CUCU|nr:hypothetical protein NQ315_013396 [Exocentrus adspersus]